MHVKTAIASCAVAATLAAAKPGVIEIDLVFPRNETYKPTPVMPIVFKFSDPNNAAQDAGGIKIGWTLLPYDGTYDFDAEGGVQAENPPFGYITPNATGDAEATFVWDAMINATTRATTWYLNWAPVGDNCTGSGNSSSIYDQNTVLHFTTADNAPETDLVPKDCKDLMPFTLNVTAEAGTEANSGSSAPYCGFADGDPPAADTCDVKLSKDEAKKIAASATSKACSAATPIITCPAGGDSAASFASVDRYALVAGAGLSALYAMI